MTFRSLGFGSCHTSQGECTAKRTEWTRAAPQAEADLSTCERQDAAYCFTVRDANGAARGVCQPSYAACLTSFDMHDLEQAKLALVSPCHTVQADGRAVAQTDEQRNTHWRCYAGARVGVGSCARLAQVCEADRKDMAKLDPGPCAPQRTAFCYERRAGGTMTRSCQPSAANCEHERTWAHGNAKPGETVGTCHERE